LEIRHTGTSSFKIDIPADLEPLIAGYIRNRLADVKQVKEALLKQNYDAVEVIGHTMKGNGSGYGMNRVSAIGKKLQLAAVNRDDTEILKQLERLTYYLEHLEIQYVE
jgi:HPt (histidine-containing phosphotransfer) domain-containing protein